MAELENEQINELHTLIVRTYNLREMKELCQQMGVNWEDVSAETTVPEFGRELVKYFERRGRLFELRDQVWYERSTVIQNYGLVEPITYNDDQDTYVSSPTSGGHIGCWVGGVIFVIVLALFWYGYSDAQKQLELRDSEAFVIGYFSLLDNINCRDAWERLSGDYRVNKHSTGLTPYCQYWNSFRKVEILKLEVLDETDTTASVEVVLALTNFDNTVANQRITYSLTRLAGTDPWIIADSNP